MNHPARKSILCPNCRKLISSDEPRCPHCGIGTPGSRLKNNPLTRGWGSGEQLIRLIIYVNVALYVYALLIGRGGGMGGGFNPLNFLSPSGPALEALGATGSRVDILRGWWTFIAANYLHGGVLHIFFNMLVLYQVGPLVARVYGPYRFFAIYTISGIGGFIVSYLAGVSLTIGASAALFGIFGAAIYYGKSRGGVFGEAVYRQIGGWAIAIIVLGFLIPHANNSAHLGGLAFGAASAYLFGYNEKKRESAAHRIIAGFCMVSTLLVLVLMVIRGGLFWMGG